MLHDNQRVDSHDRWFVCGGNPDGDGGGVIASFNDLRKAQAFVEVAIKADYTRVRVQTWEQMMGDTE